VVSGNGALRRYSDGVRLGELRKSRPQAVTRTWDAGKAGEPVEPDPVDTGV